MTTNTPSPSNQQPSSIAINGSAVPISVVNTGVGTSALWQTRGTVLQPISNPGPPDEFKAIMENAVLKDKVKHLEAALRTERILAGMWLIFLLAVILILVFL